MNLRPSGYEPDELPSCSTPRSEAKDMIKIKNKFYSITISTKLFESKIAHLLVQAERKYKNISIGSYPIFDGKPKGVEIVINSQVNKLGVSNAKKFILREINKII